ncbi:MAG TPA: hypothetical protein PKW33_11555 [Anaerolineaceae bacterium]|nr:hypothetical protein [Anaerolineaceae bacterium]HPN52216.1 hypothetical protein [Anaerolineaceae bacterium]
MSQSASEVISKILFLISQCGLAILCITNPILALRIMYIPATWIKKSAIILPEKYELLLNLLENDPEQFRETFPENVSVVYKIGAVAFIIAMASLCGLLTMI